MTTLFDKINVHLDSVNKTKSVLEYIDLLKHGAYESETKSIVKKFSQLVPVKSPYDYMGIVSTSSKTHHQTKTQTPLNFTNKGPDSNIIVNVVMSTDSINYEVYIPSIGKYFKVSRSNFENTTKKLFQEGKFRFIVVYKGKYMFGNSKLFVYKSLKKINLVYKTIYGEQPPKAKGGVYSLTSEYLDIFQTKQGFIENLLHMC